MSVDTRPAPAVPAPRLSGLPLVGPVLEAQRDLLGLYERAHREHGDMARMVLGVPPVRTTTHLVMHPDGARQVLTARTGLGKDTPVYRELRGWFGQGLLTSEGAVWERQRRLLQPLFTPRRVDGYAGVMRQEGERLAEEWTAEAARGPVDLYAGSLRYALRVVGRLLFGRPADDALAVLSRTSVPLQHHIVSRGLNPLSPPRGWPTPQGRRAARLQAEVDAAVEDVVARADPDDEDADDLVTLLLRARDPVDGTALSRQEVHEQVLVFLLAGHETTASALALTFWLLGAHPEEQERLRREAAATDDLVHGLPRARQAVQEGLRLFPSAPHVARDARQDHEILGRPVAAGDAVLVPVWVLHRDPRWWPDPLRFDPDRFAEDNPDAGSRPRYAYLPFGGGSRSCIGDRFALLEAGIALASVCERLDLRTSPPTPPLYPGIALRPAGPVLATVHARE